MSELQAESLFRRQAIEALRKKSPGRPICLMPRPWYWLNALLVVFFLSTVVFVATVEYSRKESARGWLVSSRGVIRVANNEPALIERVAKSAGEQVVVGEPLIYLSADSRMLAGNSKNEQLLGQLQQDVAELDIQLELTRQRAQLESGSLELQLRDYDSEHESLLAQTEEQRRLVDAGIDQFKRLESAALAGAVSDWDLLQQKQNLGELEQKLGALQQDLASQKRDRERLGGRRRSVPAESRIERSQLRLRRSELKQKIAELESRQLSVLTSPVHGTVATVEAHAGNAAIPQQLLMTILPANIELTAEVYVPSRAVGFIHPGQKVRLVYDAFPRQKFGTFEGRVERISDFVLLPGDVPNTFSFQEATYRVHVTINDAQVGSRVGAAGLRPGMLLMAEMVLEKRTLIDWFLEPLGFTPELS